ncbi:MAG TPA: metalloregulator ArsR/SmtB family transcription factor [Dongiaceae bacterium]
MKQPDHPKFDEISLTGVLAALSDPVRLSLVCRLSKGEELAWSQFDVDVANSTLSHHLKILREAGVTQARKEGTRCFVSLRPDLENLFPGLVGQVLSFAHRNKEQI